jgi:hypothetical protein
MSAENVDLTLVVKMLQRLTTEVTYMQDDIRALSAIVRRLDNATKSARKVATPVKPGANSHAVGNVYTEEQLKSLNRTALTVLARKISGNSTLTKEQVCGTELGRGRATGRAYILKLQRVRSNRKSSK